MKIICIPLSFLIAALLVNCGRIPSETTSRVAGASALSAVFTATCAKCHGAAGEGAFGPSLKVISYDKFASTVRGGAGAMPKFAAASYSDADLKADYRALTGLVAP